MMTRTPLQWGQQRQLEDSNNAITTRAITPLQIKGNDANVTRETTPSQQLQGCLHIDNSIDAIVMGATIAGDDGKDACALTATTFTIGLLAHLK
jgi:hypothetical protein